MGKILYSFRWRDGQEMKDFLEEEAMKEDLPVHLIVRRTMREAMKRQREFNRKCNEGFLAVAESRPGPEGIREVTRSNERKLA